MIGQTLGNYKIIRLLGAGGMGEVYLAQHTHIARQAAIKLLLPHVSTDPQTVDRFFTEARATSLIHHEGIVEILDCGTLDGRAYIVMEYLEGESLGARLSRQGSFIQNLGMLTSIGIAVARALAAAHARGIVHRDLKPDNIYLANSADGPGQVRVKILDFGIAKLTGADKEVGSSHTRAGILIGTPLYMSPEQCRGFSTVDQRTDIYALGCILFEMVAGRPPFVSENAGDLLIAHATLAPPALAELEPRVPPTLEELIGRLLAKDPAQRPQSMDEVAHALEAWNGAQRTTNTIALPSADEPSRGVLPQAGPQTSGGAAGLRSTGGGASQMGVAATAILASAPAEIPDAKLPRHTRRDGRPGKAAPEPQANPSSKRALLILGVVAGLALISVGGLWARRQLAGAGGDKIAAPGTSEKKSLSAEPTEEEKLARQAPAGMVAIVGRPFAMGSTPAEVEAGFAFCKSIAANCRREVFEREQPQRTITVDSFFMDTMEVTNAAFARWLNTSGASVRDQRMVRDAQDRLLADLHPLHGGVEGPDGEFRPRSGRGELPAVQVTWWGAKAFCAAQGKRLPSEAEWERAARATSAVDPLRFPWGGGKPQCETVAFGGGAKGACPSTVGPRAVGTSPGDVTTEGVHDLGGNVGEWVADAFRATYDPCLDGACKNPLVLPEASDLRVIRGGDWLQTADACRSTGRSRRAPDKAEINVGFRCVR